MEEKYKHYLAFLRFAIDEEAPVPPCLRQIDWNDMLKFSRKQGIVGVMYHGLRRLPADQPGGPDKYVAAAWFAADGKNAARARRADRDTALLVSRLHHEGHIEACVLKGQGNALMYPDPHMRSPGDVDLWTDQDTLSLLCFVKTNAPRAEIGYHHVDFSGFTRTPAEIHFFPSFMGNLLHEYRLRCYFNRVRAEQFARRVRLPGAAGSVPVPTDDFNRIFQLSHIMHHFFFEGIGLRQLIDYYYLLRRGFTSEEQRADAQLLRHTGMLKFGRGVMWLLHEVLGLPGRYMLVEPNERVGRLLLREVLLAGNFGHHDKRYNFKGKSVYTQYFIETWRNLHFALEFPSETIWGRPVSRWWHMAYKAYLRRRVARKIANARTHPHRPS